MNSITPVDTYPVVQSQLLGQVLCLLRLPLCAPLALPLLPGRLLAELLEVGRLAGRDPLLDDVGEARLVLLGRGAEHVVHDVVHVAVAIEVGRLQVRQLLLRSLVLLLELGDVGHSDFLQRAKNSLKQDANLSEEERCVNLKFRCHLEEQPPVLIPVFVGIHVVALVDVAGLVVDGPPILVREQFVDGPERLEPLLEGTESI